MNITKTWMQTHKLNAAEGWALCVAYFPKQCTCHRAVPVLPKDIWYSWQCGDPYVSKYDSRWLPSENPSGVAKCGPDGAVSSQCQMKLRCIGIKVGPILHVCYYKSCIICAWRWIQWRKICVAPKKGQEGEKCNSMCDGNCIVGPSWAIHEHDDYRSQVTLQPQGFTRVRTVCLHIAAKQCKPANSGRLWQYKSIVSWCDRHTFLQGRDTFWRSTCCCVSSIK